jgi:hypothetical protein
MKRIRKTLNVHCGETFDVFSHDESLSKCWSKSVKWTISELSKSWSDSNIFSRRLMNWLWRRSLSGCLCQTRSRR